MAFCSGSGSEPTVMGKETVRVIPPLYERESLVIEQSIYLLYSMLRHSLNSNKEQVLVVRLFWSGQGSKVLIVSRI
jgi:hypothetical protein